MYNVSIIHSNDEAKRLAALYISEKVMSAAYQTDALHIAMTSVSGLDYIVSLNFQHIVRPWTIEQVEKINAREGYKKIGLYTPEEVLEKC